MLLMILMILIIQMILMMPILIMISLLARPESERGTSPGNRPQDSPKTVRAARPAQPSPAPLYIYIYTYNTCLV